MNIDFTGLFFASLLENFIPVFIALIPFLLCILIPAIILNFILKSDDAWKVGGFLGFVLYFIIFQEQTFNLF